MQMPELSQYLYFVLLLGFAFIVVSLLYCVIYIFYDQTHLDVAFVFSLYWQHVLLCTMTIKTFYLM